MTATATASRSSSHSMSFVDPDDLFRSSARLLDSRCGVCVWTAFAEKSKFEYARDDAFLTDVAN